MASGQGPNASTKGDCDTPTTLGGGSPEPAEGAWHFDSNGQAVDDSGADPIGCTYPAAVKNISDQLQDAQITWKGYMENMDADPNITPACSNPFNRGPNVNPGYRHDAQNPDNPQYKDKHNPFSYFHSLFDQQAYCAEHVVPLGYLDADGTTPHGALVDDLQQLATTPQFSFITPDQCHDGHDGCANSGGDKYAGVDQFLKAFVPLIMNSDAYKQDGLIVITTDEGSTNLWCCGEENQKAPNLADNDNNGAGPAEIGAPVPDPIGDGGGKVGALLLSPFITDHSQDSTHSFNHYSYLRSMEDLFGLPHLGYAAADGLQTFQDAGLIPASTPGPELPEAPLAVLLVVAAAGSLVVTTYVRRRRSLSTG